ncbi:hypothetical protein HEP_00288500, partial [Hepatocystis sp. ex Piliocolobus tephrosceles]
MDALIKLNEKLYVDLNNYYDKVDDTEDLEIFDTSISRETRNEEVNDVTNNIKIEIKKQLDIFNDLLKYKNINLDISQKIEEKNNLDIIRIVQSINNSYVKKNEELHYTRLLMIIHLKNYVSEYVNTYLTNIIKNYEKNKYKSETNSFNNIIVCENGGENGGGSGGGSGSKNSGENGGDKTGNYTENTFIENTFIEYHDKKAESAFSSQHMQNQFLFITFMKKNITENLKLIKNVVQNDTKCIRQKEWEYLKEKILLLIKNSCLISYTYNSNIGVDKKKSKEGTKLDELINNNMYRNFKKYKSIVEMHKFNMCLYFIDIFFNLFLIDYPYNWNDNIIVQIFNTFKFVSIIKNNDFSNVLNNDYNSIIGCLMDLIRCNDMVENVESITATSVSNKSHNFIQTNCINGNTYSLIIHFQNFYSLIFVLNKIIKKYNPKCE